MRTSDKSLEAKEPVIVNNPETVDAVEIPEPDGKCLIVEKPQGVVVETEHRDTIRA